MALHSAPVRSRGVDFLLGGVFVAVCFVAFAIAGGGIDFGLGGAPSVRIDEAAFTVAN